MPPDQTREIIELLRPRVAVRAAGPVIFPMPRGTLTLPAQTTPGVAAYGGERTKLAESQQSFGQIVATYQKLTALTRVSNDLMRYSDPAVARVI